MEWSDHWVSIICCHLLTLIDSQVHDSICIKFIITYCNVVHQSVTNVRMWKWNHKHIVNHVQSRVAQPSLFTVKNELTKNGKRSCRYVDVLSTFSSILAQHISSLEGNVLVFLSQIILNIIFLLSSPILRRAWCQWSSRIELKAIWGTIKRRGCWTWSID